MNFCMWYIHLKDTCIFTIFYYINMLHISNNSNFRQKHPGVPDGADGSDGTLYPLAENYMLPVAQVTGRIS